MNKKLKEFKNIHKDKTIIVCGCGESLNNLPVNKKIITIGVNDVGRLFNPTYLVVLNLPGQFKENRYQYVKTSKARAIFSQFALDFPHPAKVRIKLGHKGGTNINSTAGLPYTQNSPYVAVCLAALMGAKRIGIIGVDFSQHHFFGKTGKHPLNDKLESIDQEYQRLYLALARQKIELVNLSEQSRLESIPKMDLQTFLKNPLKQSGQINNRSRKLKNHNQPEKKLNIVQIAKTNCAGALWNLHHLINKYTVHSSRVITCSRITNGRVYPKDVLLNDKERVIRLLKQADIIHFHNWLDKDSVLLNPYRQHLVNKAAVLQFHSEPAVLQQAFPGRNLVTRKDLKTLVVAQKQARFYPNAQAVQNALDINLEPFNHDHDKVKKFGPLRVLYAPTDKQEYRKYTDTCRGKGFKGTRTVLKNLESEGLIDAVIVSDLSWEVLSDLRRTCDVVIDECVTGGYHLSSLEALAQGAVTIAFLDDETQKLLMRVTGCRKSELPWINSKLNDLENTLRKLVKNKKRVEKLKIKSREWMEKYWQPESIVGHYIQNYVNTIENGSRDIKDIVNTQKLCNKNNTSRVIAMPNVPFNPTPVIYSIAGKQNPRRSEELAQSIHLSTQLLKRQTSLQGHSCHILGNGPSVNSMDLSLLQHRCVIAVNSSPLLFNELGRVADYYCVSDRRFLQHRTAPEYIQKSRGTIRVFAGYCEGIIDEPDINYVKICGGDGISSNIKDGFYHDCSVVLFATQLALWLGCTDIYLHGCEFDYSDGRFNKLDQRPHDANIYKRVRKNAVLLVNKLRQLSGQLSVVGPSRLTGDFGDNAIPHIKPVKISRLEQALASATEVKMNNRSV